MTRQYNSKNTTDSEIPKDSDGFGYTASKPQIFISYSRKDARFVSRLIYVLNSEGIKRMITDFASDREPAWSPR